MNDQKLDFKTTKLAEDVAEAVMWGLVNEGELNDPTREKLEEIQQRLVVHKNKSQRHLGYKGKRRRKKWW